MSKKDKSKPLSSSDIRGPEAHFNAYCEDECERRSNSGEAFDEALFAEAVKLAKRKLQVRMRRSLK